ncbi:MAG TPA: hypothetical protein VHB79_34355 [Polyangiaceae bacterium]|nr:hypothetical protein [Polyangiaceae bacterium]
MRVRLFPVLVLLSLAACQKNEASQEESTKKEKKDESAQDKVGAIDPDLAEAVAAASVEAPAGKGPPQPKGVEGGPPPDGVFAPGAADKEIARGALPKITLGSEGADPKQQLGLAKSPQKLSGTIQIALQSDPRQGAIPVLLNVVLEPKKAEAGKDDKAAVSQPVSVRIVSAKIDAPGVPKDVDEQLAKLKGAKVEYSILPSGAGAGFRFDTPKGAPEEFKDVVRSLSDALALLTIPYPDKPLGAGGFFMVTSREDLLGLDLVTYRMIKIKEVTPQGVTLDVNTKRYAANRVFDFPGLPAEIDKNLAEFQASSEGTLQYPLGALIPTQGQVNSVLAAQLGAKEPGKRAMLQFQTRAQLDLK